jgi:hypothetical protein
VKATPLAHAFEICLDVEAPFAGLSDNGRLEDLLHEFFVRFILH